MTYIVLDLEFNQNFDFKKNKNINIIPRCRFEIFQIGAVKLNDEFEIIDEINLYMKLNLYKRMHPYVKKITNIDEKFLKNKPDFKTAYKNFKSFIGNDKDIIYCVWGRSDLRALYRNLSYYKIIKGDLILKYIDIQQLATKHLNFSKGSCIGLKHAIEILDLPIGEDFHNALNDAKYTADIFKKIGNNNSSNNNNNIKVFNSKNVPARSKT